MKILKSGNFYQPPSHAPIKVIKTLTIETPDNLGEFASNTQLKNQITPSPTMRKKKQSKDFKLQPIGIDSVYFSTSMSQMPRFHEPAMSDLQKSFHPPKSREKTRKGSKIGNVGIHQLNQIRSRPNVPISIEELALESYTQIIPEVPKTQMPKDLDCKGRIKYYQVNHTSGAPRRNKSESLNPHLNKMCVTEEGSDFLYKEWSYKNYESLAAIHRKYDNEERLRVMLESIQAKERQKQGGTFGGTK
jgi:hypothetical protein